MDRVIYADNAATTKVSERVLNAMLPYLKEEYGNASSWFYKLGQTSAAALEKAREQTAKAINAEPREIYFTSCGSESDNWALRGAAEKLLPKGKKHIVTSVFEHHAILHTCKYLEKNPLLRAFSCIHLIISVCTLACQYKGSLRTASATL